MNESVSQTCVAHISGINVRDLLAGSMIDWDKPILTIPNYQRGYCWGKKTG